MNKLYKSFAYVVIMLVFSMNFLISPNTLGSTLSGNPGQGGCHNEIHMNTHENNNLQTITTQEQVTCCKTGLCLTGICCAYTIPGGLHTTITNHPELIYKQKGKIFGFSTTTQSIIQPPG